MSFFGGKHETYAYTSIAPMMGENINNSLKDAVLKYIRMGGDLTSTLLAAKQNSTPIRIKRINKWIGSGTDKYHYGALKSSYLSYSEESFQDYIQLYLSTLVGHTVTRIYTTFEGINNYHAVWDKLITLYGYNPTTNIIGTLTTSVGTNCYFYDAEIGYIQRTIDSILNPLSLNPLPNSVAFTSGITQNRSQDFSRAHTPYTSHGSFATSYGTSSNKDLLTIKYTYRRVSTRTEVFNDTLSTTVSDDTTSDIATPTVYDSVSSNVFSTTTDTVNVLFSTPPDVFHSIRTVVTVTHYDYICSIDTDFLEYEFSGYINENVYLGDTNVINPSAVGGAYAETYASGSYFQCYYTYNDGSVKYGYYTYEYGDGLNITLDNIFEESLELDKYFPRIYLRLNGLDLTGSTFVGTPAYTSSIKLGKKLGIDWKNLSKQLHENIGELENVSQIIVSAIVPLSTTNPSLLKYLFEWFKLQYLTASPDPYSVHVIFGSDLYLYSLRVGNTIQFKDSEYTCTLSYWAIGHRSVTGSIGTIGTVNRISILGSLRVLYQYQVSLTVYEEVIVVYPVGSQFFSGMRTVAFSNSEDITVPLDMDVVLSLPFKYQEAIVNAAMHVIINTTVTVKVSWYETPIFRAVMQAVALIFALPTGGQSLTLAAVFEAAAIVVLETVIIQAIAKVLVNVFNIDVGVASAIIAVVTLLAAGYAKFDGSTVLSLTAKELLQITNIAFKLSEEGFKLQAKALADERLSFMSMTEVKQAELDAAKALITKVHSMKDYLLMSTNMSKEFYVLGESPTDYYNRTVHSGNVGALLPTLLSASSGLLLLPPSVSQSLNQVIKR